jgi:hypothetical protein
MVSITVKCQPGRASSEIRTLFCLAHVGKLSIDKDASPLTETNFNKLLEEIAQEAFNEGIHYQKSVKIPDNYYVQT